MIAIGAYQPGLQPTRRSASRSWLRGNGRASLLAQRHALSGLSGGGSPEPTQEQVLQKLEEMNGRLSTIDSRLAAIQGDLKSIKELVRQSVATGIVTFWQRFKKNRALRALIVFFSLIVTAASLCLNT